MRIDGVPPSEAEIDAWCGRLQDVVAGGGSLKLIQVYTVARPPAESNVTALSMPELEGIASRVRAMGIPAEVYGA
jgi:hypothetical protein